MWGDKFEKVSRMHCWIGRGLYSLCCMQSYGHTEESSDVMVTCGCRDCSQHDHTWVDRFSRTSSLSCKRKSSSRFIYTLRRYPRPMSFSSEHWKLKWVPKSLCPEQYPLHFSSLVLQGCCIPNFNLEWTDASRASRHQTLLTSSHICLLSHGQDTIHAEKGCMEMC